MFLTVILAHFTPFDNSKNNIDELQATVASGNSNETDEDEIKITSYETVNTNVFTLKTSNSTDTFYSHVKISSNAVIAEFQQLNIISETLWEYQFKAVEWLYGEYTDDIIRVRVALNGWNNEYRIEGNLKAIVLKEGIDMPCFYIVTILSSLNIPDMNL